MFRKLWIVVFMLLLPFGAMACSQKPPTVPTSTVSYETAMQAITELADKMKDQEDRLNKFEERADSSVLERLTTMEEALSKIEEFRAENPGHFGRVVDTTFTDKLKFECVGEVPGFGQRDLFKLGGKTLFCTQPGIARPADGSVCFNIPGTLFWDCGYGQILRECVHCGCGTPTSTPVVPPTSTPVVPPTSTPVVPPTNTWTPPTSQPTPYGTATCEFPCDNEVLDLTKREKLPRDEFGTILQTPPNGKHLPLGGKDIVVREEVRMCQIHVLNAWKVQDRVTGLTKVGCVVAYRRGYPGDDTYHEVNYIASDGYAYHIESRNAGFGLQEGVSQMVLALQEARKDDGSFACRRSGDPDPARQKAQDIQFMELGLR